MNQESSELTSTRPYLLRAMHEWMTDNGQTPLVVVDATQPGVQVPAAHVEKGSIVLNVSWNATRNLQLGTDSVTFEARFGGNPHQISVPMAAVQGIYARESGQGMMFQDQPTTDTSPVGVDSDSKPHFDPAAKPSGDDDTPGKPGGPPSLRIVK